METFALIERFDSPVSSSSGLRGLTGTLTPQQVTAIIAMVQRRELGDVTSQFDQVLNDFPKYRRRIIDAIQTVASSTVPPAASPAVPLQIDQTTVMTATKMQALGISHDFTSVMVRTSPDMVALVLTESAYLDSQRGGFALKLILHETIEFVLEYTPDAHEQAVRLTAQLLSQPQQAPCSQQLSPEQEALLSTLEDAFDKAWDLGFKYKSIWRWFVEFENISVENVIATEDKLRAAERAFKEKIEATTDVSVLKAYWHRYRDLPATIHAASQKMQIEDFLATVQKRIETLDA